MSQELKETISTQELSTLQQQRQAYTRLQECMDFMDIMTAADPDALFGVYCTASLNLEEQEMLDFGVPASAVRTAVRLKQLRSLHFLLRDLHIDPVATLSPPYTCPLTEAQETRLRAACRQMEDPNVVFSAPDGSDAVGSTGFTGASGNIKMLLGAVKRLLLEQHQDFREGVPPHSSDPADHPGDPLNTNGGMYGYFEFAVVNDNGQQMALSDYDWFNKAFPEMWGPEGSFGSVDGLSTKHLKGVYELLVRIDKEGQVNHAKFTDMGVSGRAAIWEQRMN